MKSYSRFNLSIFLITLIGIFFLSPVLMAEVQGQVEVTVRSASEPAQGIRVYLFSVNGSYLGIYHDTDVNGKTSFELPVGNEYKFRADIMGNMYWSDVITILSDQTNQALIEAGGGRLQVTVEKSSGEVMQGVNTYLFNTSGAYLGLSQVSDSSGKVTFSVPAGDYKVRADYLGSQFWTSLTTVITDTNFTLAIPHQEVVITVAGMHQGTGSPIGGINVYLFNSAGSYMGLYSVTDSSGHVTFNLPEQPYKVRADYLGQQFWSSDFIWQDTTVNIPIADTVITVTGAGQALAGVNVYVFNSAGSYLGITGLTQADGKAGFRLPTGPYKFRADYQGSQYWSNEEVLGESEVPPVGISTGGGTFAFTVLKSATEPLAGVPCYLFNESGSYLGLSATTSSEGRVSFNLADGNYKFRVDYLGCQFWSNVYAVPETLSDAFTLNHHDVTITALSQFLGETGPTSGVMVYLFSPTGTYLGKNAATDSAGHAVFNLPDMPYKVRVDYLNQQYWSEAFTSSAPTVNIPMADAEITVTGGGQALGSVSVYVFSQTGSYLGINGSTDTNGKVIFRLPQATYKFRADYQGSQYWTGEVTLSADQVNPVAVSTGGGAFLLTVFKGTGEPLGGVNCYVFNEGGAYLGISATADTNGLASFNLADGSYKFRIDYMGYQFWTGAYVVPTTLSDEFTIPHQDVAIAVNGLYQAAQPMEGLTVYLFTSIGSYLGQNQVTDSDGRVVFNLPDQSYKVRADYLGNQFWSESFQSQDTTVTIPEGIARIHVSIAGSDMNGLNVYLFSESNAYLGINGVTDVSGTCEFELPAASFKFRVDEAGAQTWTDVVAVTAGGITNVEADLSPVSPLPTVTLNANPENIQAGASSTLTWSSTDTDSCTIEPGTIAVASSGSIVVTPTDTTTYTIMAIGPEGTATSSVTIFISSSIAEQIKITEPDAKEYNSFGGSVSISGDYAIVASYGSVYIFKREGATWTEQTKLPANNDYSFGRSVAINGDYALVSGSGPVHIFKREGETWNEQANLIPSDMENLYRFGTALSISGDYVIIGASREDENEDEFGSAYIFKREGTTWTEQAKLLAGDGGANDFFGRSVSIDGDYAIVGAYRDDDNGYNAGAAYIFKRDGATWKEQSKLTADNGGEEGRYFGCGVSISGDYAIVSYNGDPEFPGSARIFMREGNTWTEQAKIVPSDPEAVYCFGMSVSIDGNEAIVGAYDGNYVGAAYIFRREGTIWTEQKKLLASDGQAFNGFGDSVCINGGYAIVGAHGDNENGRYSGAAYIYPVLTLDIDADLEIVQAGDSSTLTWETSHAESVFINQNIGAVGNDGALIRSHNETTTYTITATGLGSTITDHATVNVVNSFMLPTVSLIASPEIVAQGGTTTLSWNSTLADTCTIEPDIGTVDISGSIIVSPTQTTTYTITATGPGGSASSNVQIIVPWAIPAENKITACDGEAWEYFGESVSLSGDYAIVGAPEDDDNGGYSGSAYIFKKQGTTWVENQKLVPGDGAAWDHFGQSVSISGDYAIIGAYGESTNGYSSGAAYIYKLENEIWTEQVKLINSDNQEFDYFGGSVSISGDYAIATGGGSAYVFKRDGATWTEQTKLDSAGGPVHINGEYVIIGEPNYDGSAFIYKRVVMEDEEGEGDNYDLWTRQAKLSGDGTNYPVVEYYFGQSVAINGEYAVVGAGGHAGQKYDSGAVYIFKRDGSRWIRQQRLTASDSHLFQNFGESVSIDGNYIAVGAPGDGYNAEFFGAAYIYNKTGDQWTEQKKYIAADQGDHVEFGYSVCLASGHVIVGTSESESAYIYPVQTINAEVDSESILMGSYSTLTWNCLHADSVVINHGIGAVDNTGSITLSPTETTTYTITATGPVGVTTEQITIVVINPSVFPTVNITVMPEVIGLGETARLTWNSFNADYCVIEPDIGRVSASGSVEVSPEIATTYTISATGPQGTAKANAKLSLLPSAEISVSPSTIPIGESATLTWNASNADSCVIEPGIGSVAANGSIEVWPTDVTTYTITAANQVGTAVENVTVTVTAAVEISASPEAIRAGESAVLTWHSTSADTCIIDPDIGSVESNGSVSVSPAMTTTYTITGTGLGGTGTDSVTVTVYYPPNITIRANPETVFLGNAVKLTWNVTNADSITIDHGIGAVAASGSITLSPVETTTYTMTASGLGGATTKEVTVTVTSLHAINITSPVFGASISRPDIMVTGTITYAAGSEVGVTVNGMVAMVYENKFVVNHVPLEQGANVINAVAVDSNGNTLETSVLVSGLTGEKYVMLTADEYEGISPFEIKQTINASFDMINQTLSYVRAPNGTVLLIDHPSDTEYVLRLTGPGIYYFTAEVKDDGGNIYADTVGVVVLDGAIVDDVIKARWNGMKSKLVQNDIEGAMDFFSPVSKSEYQEIFTILSDELPQLAAAMEDIEAVYMRGNVAKYRIKKNETINGETNRISYYIYFLKDTYGRWHIDTF